MIGWLDTVALVVGYSSLLGCVVLLAVVALHAIELHRHRRDVSPPRLPSFYECERIWRLRT